MSNDSGVFSGSGTGGGSFTPDQAVPSGVVNYDLMFGDKVCKVVFTPDSVDNFKTEDVGKCTILIDGGAPYVCPYKRTNFIPVSNPFASFMGK